MPFAFPGQAIVGRDGRRVIAGPSAVARTYAEFQAHIATLATGGDFAWSGVQPTAGTFRVTAGSPPVNGSDIFHGTSWNDYFRRHATNGSISMAVCHGLPSQAEVLNQSSRARQMLVEIEAGTAPAFNALLRNGFQSSTTTLGLSSAGRLKRLLAWIGDDLTGSAIEMQPSLGLGPTPYTW